MEILSVISSWGPLGVLGYVGCHLVIMGIAGRYVSMLKLKPATGKTSHLTQKQRWLFCIFGSLLAAPLIIQLYLQVKHNEPVKLYEEVKVDEYVKPIDSPKSQERNFAGSALMAVNYSPGVLPAESNAAQGCQVVEAFGLDQRSVRRLKYAGFQNNVCLYVGDIHYTWYSATTVHIIVGSPEALPTGGMNPSEFNKRISRVSDGNRWVLRVNRQGDFTQFAYNGKNYRVTVKGIHASLLGTDRIAVEVCEMN
ncbi:MAG: hypothetical protein AB1631_16705 [Acidobacteriota bacterium]